MRLFGDVLHQNCIDGDIERNYVEFSRRKAITKLAVFRKIRVKGFQLILTESRPIGLDGRSGIIC